MRFMYTNLITCLLHLRVQTVTVYKPLTWGLHTEPPPDVPECGFLREFCLPPTEGEFPGSRYITGCQTATKIRTADLDETWHVYIGAVPGV